MRYTLSHAHLTTDVAALVSSTAVGAWVAAKAGMAMLIDHVMATMGHLDGQHAKIRGNSCFVYLY